MVLRFKLFDRLRDKGRWELASLARMEERERLRAAGLTRRAANEQSWAWLEREFPPLPVAQCTLDEAECFAAMAHLPLTGEGLDGANETSFAAFWWVYSYLLAWEIQAQSRRTAHGPRYLSEMRQEAPDFETSLLAHSAMRDVRSFFRLWRAKLRAVLDRWQEQPPEDEVDRLALESELKTVESLILAFPRSIHFAKEQPGVHSGGR